MDKQIIVTADQSNSIFIPETNETYHSIHGALQESMHVYIKAGLGYLENLKNVKLFEMGLGTGLNCALTLQWVTDKGIKINYHALEKHPLKSEILKELNFNLDYFEAIHQAEWGKEIIINTDIKLKKDRGDISHFDLSDNDYDIVFYDAFGPSTQPELWTEEIMQKMFKCLKKDGVLITYCAQGQFKRNLKSVGFKIENLPGPPGKREITRAYK